MQVTRDKAAYDTTRNFQIAVDEAGTTVASTPANRQIYVEHLVSQFRNSITSITGPGIGGTAAMKVGDQAIYTVSGQTAPGGYEQLVFATVFDPAFFDVVSVSQTYTADSALSRVPNPNSQVYADGCLWQNDFTLVTTYRSCLSTGKVGGVMTSSYTVRAKAATGAGGTRLATEIYDFSGSSYHYNADFGTELLNPIVVIDTNPTPPPPQTLQVVKTASPSTFSASGETITFFVEITNTGTDVLTSPKVTDSLPGVTIECPGGSVGVGEKITCTGNYLVTPPDVNAGIIQNTVTVTGKIGNQNTGFGQASVVVPRSTAGVLTLAKSATVAGSPAPPAAFSAGVPIDYSFLVTNTGPVALSNLVIADDHLDAPAVCTYTTLPPSAAAICHGSYVPTQDDVDAGEVTNVATATANPTGGAPVTSNPATVTVSGPPAIRTLDVVKSFATGPGTTFTAAGDVLHYRFDVQNTGNVTLTDVAITDAGLDAAADCMDVTLQPGQSTTCIGTHTVTDGDVTAGFVTNSATAEGTAGGVQTQAQSNPVTANATAAAISVVKTGSSRDPAEPWRFEAVGDAVDYSVTATNTGAVTLTDVTVTDPSVALACDRAQPRRSRPPSRSRALGRTPSRRPTSTPASSPTRRPRRAPAAGRRSPTATAPIWSDRQPTRT